MPVFFYIDPKIEEDRNCKEVNNITLSYTFWPISGDEEEDEDVMEGPGAAEQAKAMLESIELARKEREQAKKSGGLAALNLPTVTSSPPASSSSSSSSSSPTKTSGTASQS